MNKIISGLATLILMTNLGCNSYQGARGEDDIIPRMIRACDKGLEGYDGLRTWDVDDNTRFKVSPRTSGFERIGAKTELTHERGEHESLFLGVDASYNNRSNIYFGIEWK
ncbi:hypothetical protein COU61_04605 [Candidatus Pacearchaeota archaeon CG10_big_fil_rev_8_21_14_0_10_35_13]|nr:MAG: hypothetical protein COU61_04605 [Candidatus Pacearchaeota archaeon CG10_big_fil_rev_8_21_14_0_10_35_13]